MTTQQGELAARKQALLHQLDSQRTELKMALEEWQAPLSTVDKGLNVARYLNHPALLGGLALLATIGQQGMLVWVTRGWWLWKTAVSVKRKL